MSDFVDRGPEPATFRERFDAIETVLAIQRKRLEAIEGELRTSKLALGVILAALSKVVGGIPIPVELAEELGLKASPIVQASSIHRAS